MPGILAVFLLSIGFLSGCASAPPKAPPLTQDTIILLPDASGKTGAIVVSGGGQEVRLSETSQAVVVREGSAPGKPFIMSDKDVASFAAPALKALPPPPKQYILYFEHNSAELTRKSREQLANVMKTIKERRPVDISVVGHTDTVGDSRYNYRLSCNRARAVADLLVAQGVDRSILDITSHGKENPLIPTGDQVHEPRNRRVEVTVR
ncbi:MAG: hypothetical protein H6Q84_3651 [Deltaproteobacteria bacterium]|nr:hypothetical protein [Deltaproteobacteria bacterium]